MILYLSIIFVGMALLTAADLIFAAPHFGFGFWFALGGVSLNVVLAIAVDGLFAFLIRRMPAKWFSHDKKIFQVSAREKKFYETLKIRKWKDKIPELGQFTAFRKNKIADPKNNEVSDTLHVGSVLRGSHSLRLYIRRLFYHFLYAAQILAVFRPSRRNRERAFESSVRLYFEI